MGRCWSRVGTPRHWLSVGTESPFLGLGNERSESVLPVATPLRGSRRWPARDELAVLRFAQGEHDVGRRASARARRALDEVEEPPDQASDRIAPGTVRDGALRI